MFGNFITSLPVKRGGSLSFLTIFTFAIPELLNLIWRKIGFIPLHVCRMITWVVFLRMFWNFISSLPVKRGGSLSFLVGTISNVLVMKIGWTDVGSGGYILVSCAHSNTSYTCTFAVLVYIYIFIAPQKPLNVTGVATSDLNTLQVTWQQPSPRPGITTYTVKVYEENDDATEFVYNKEKNISGLIM